MKRSTLAWLWFLLAMAPAFAQAPGAGHPFVNDSSNANYAPQYCQVTVTTTAASLSSLLSTAGCAAIPAWASVAYLTPETTVTIALRWRSDGTAPTASVGQPAFGMVKAPCLLGWPAINGASLISATGGSVTVDVQIGG